MKSKDLYNTITSELRIVYDESEASNIAGILLEELFNINQIDLNNNKEVNVNPQIEEALKRLKTNEPIQYVLGKAHFYGYDFKVNPNVLIPRRETEELVYHIIQDHPNFNGKILDIGTGSGCIPITLAMELPNSTVEAIDISKQALEVAKGNAISLNSNIKFHELDILSTAPLPSTYDVIVSNPPYVMNKEKALMRKNVLDYEPKLALFVDDENPLLYYNTIIAKAKESLNPNGKLYFEINEQFGEEIAQNMKESGFEHIQIIRDMQGKYRIVRGSIG